MTQPTPIPGLGTTGGVKINISIQQGASFSNAHRTSITAFNAFNRRLGRIKELTQDAVTYEDLWLSCANLAYTSR